MGVGEFARGVGKAAGSERPDGTFTVRQDDAAAAAATKRTATKCRRDAVSSSLRSCQGCDAECQGCQRGGLGAPPTGGV